MTTHRDARARRTIMPILEQLIAGRHIGTYAFFFLSGEGVFYPDGTEETSGHVIDSSGRTYAFWTGWDTNRGAVTLSQWDPVDAEPQWIQSPEYRGARDAVGLGS
jgi:hypothetical protein